MTTAAIITIGDEILIGQIVDTNSALIATHLNLIGVKVGHMRSVSDQGDDISIAIEDCLKQYDIVITTGGLGPTKDDITKDIIRRVCFSDGFYESKEQFIIIKRLLSNRRGNLIEINKSQALIPNKTRAIPNDLGTAPCIAYRFSEDEYKHCPLLYSLPGVPFETKELLPKVISDINSQIKHEEIFHRTLLTYGMPESLLSQHIEPWELNLPEDIKLAYLPSPITGIKLRLSVYGGQKEEAEHKINKEVIELRKYIPELIYGEGEDTLQSVIGETLKRNNLKLSIAESCTGGKVSALITSISGSSEYYLGSVTAYNNKIKENILSVPHSIIDSYGAVSKECVEYMAKGVLRLMNSDFSIATSGIAGPNGGSPDKPVGTVWACIAQKDPISGEIRTFASKHISNSNRDVNSDRFASFALNLLRIIINQNNPINENN